MFRSFRGDLSHPEEWHLAVSHGSEGKITTETVKIVLNEERNFIVTLDNGKTFEIANNFHLADKIITQHIDDKEVILQLMSRDYSGGITFQYMGTKYQLKVQTIMGHNLSKYMLPKKVVDTSSVIVAPMPGLVKSLAVKVGDKVSEGQELCVLEAMKMQNSMAAAKSGVIKAVYFKAGQTVTDDDIIIELE